MKTIKFTLFGLIALLVAVLSLKYTVVSLQYITTDFITTESKDIVNFGLTFAIQAIVLFTIACASIAVMVGSFQLAIKYYHIGAKVRRDKALINHIEDERYNELVDKLRNTKSIALKREYIDEYLNRNKLNPKVKDFVDFLKSIRKEDIEDKIVPERDTYNPNAKEPIKSDLFPKEGIDFIPVDRNIHKK